MTPEQLATKQEFDGLINMTPEEMTAHFASPASDFASLHPPLAKKLNQVSGKTLGKEALALKQKSIETWEDADHDKCRECVGSIKRFLGRKVAYKTAEGQATPFAISLMNRGHDPAKVVPIPVQEGTADLSDEAKRRKVEEALAEMFDVVLGGEMPEEIKRPWVRYDGMYSDAKKFVFEWQGTLFETHFAWSETGSAIIDPNFYEVTQSYIPVVDPMDTVNGELVEVAEAVDGEAPKWIGYMIRAGKAKNAASNGLPRDYTEEALKAAVAEGMFDNVPGYNRTDKEHIEEKGTDPVGWWGKAVWDDAAKAVKNTFTWIADRYPKFIDKKIRIALAEGKRDQLPGFSFTGDIYALKAQPNVVAELAEVRSCDPISNPSAGGILLAVTESISDKEGKTMKLTDALKAKGIDVPASLKDKYEKVAVAEGALSDYAIAELKAAQPKMFEEDDTLEATLAKNEKLLLSLFKMFMASKGVESMGADPATDPTATPAQEADRRSVQEAQDTIADLALTGMIEVSGLDEDGKAIVRSRMKGQPFSKEKVSEAIRDTKDLFTKIAAKSQPRLVGVVRDQRDKVQEAFNDILLFDLRDHRERQAVREACDARKRPGISLAPPRHIMSIHAFTELAHGPVEWTDPISVQEAMDTVAAAGILADGFNLVLETKWPLASEYDSWRKLVKIRQTTDMKAKYVMVKGSLAGWTARNSSTGYAVMTESGATKETYTPAGVGGIHRIGLNDFVNDNVGLFQQIPDDINDAAKEAISYFVWYTCIQANPTLATDSKAVFHADHGNIIALPLDATGLLAAYAAMRSTQFPGQTTRPLLLNPKYIGISTSPTQETTADGLVTPAFGQPNMVATTMQKKGLEVVMNPHTTDYTDWYLFCGDPSKIIEIGFYGGNEIPQIVVSNSPEVGRRFTHDEIEVKGSHYYDGTVVSPKSMVWSQVAG